MEKKAKQIIEITKKKCQAADLKAWTQFGQRIDYVANKVETIASNDSLLFSLRVIKNGRLGIAKSQNPFFNPRELVEKAIFNASFGPECFFKLPKELKIKKESKRFDQKTADLSLQEMKDFSEKEIKRLRLHHRDILINTTFGKTSSEVLFLNSFGLFYKNKTTAASFLVVGARKKEGDFLTIYDYISKSRFDAEFKCPVDEVSIFFKLSQRIATIKKGKFPVYFHPSSFNELLKRILTALNGKNILLGTSYLKDKFGKSAFDQKIDIFEDPFLDWSNRSRSFDDEGIACTRKDLIKNGKVFNFFYDLQTAAKSGKKSGGNGFRPPASQANPGLTNVVIKGGIKSEKEIIQGIKEGLYIRDTLGGFTNDPYSGDMSLQCCLAFKIKDGKIVGRIKDSMIFLNVFDVLDKNLLELSKERKWVGNFYIPGALISDISLSVK